MFRSGSGFHLLWIVLVANKKRGFSDDWVLKTNWGRGGVCLSHEGRAPGPSGSLPLGVVAALFGGGLTEAFEVAADGGQHWPESAAGHVPGVAQI
ncbi:Uncharacterised protein [Mycobacteroides abscessus subsp. massiliense]|nr:Uncharacterised protein [Mycobacteroides abscessus subsp. massiliense]